MILELEEEGSLQVHSLPGLSSEGHLKEKLREKEKKKAQKQTDTNRKQRCRASILPLVSLWGQSRSPVLQVKYQ